MRFHTSNHIRNRNNSFHAYLEGHEDHDTIAMVEQGQYNYHTRRRSNDRIIHQYNTMDVNKKNLDFLNIPWRGVLGGEEFGNVNKGVKPKTTKSSLRWILTLSRCCSNTGRKKNRDWPRKNTWCGSSGKATQRAITAGHLGCYRFFDEGPISRTVEDTMVWNMQPVTETPFFSFGGKTRR
jgi:hypothetical protein